MVAKNHQNIKNIASGNQLFINIKILVATTKIKINAISLDITEKVHLRWDKRCTMDSLLLNKKLLRGSLVPCKEGRELRTKSRNYVKLQQKQTILLQEMERTLEICNIRIYQFCKQHIRKKCNEGYTTNCPTRNQAKYFS